MEKRSKANLVGVWLFSILAVVGILLMTLCLQLTIMDAQSPDSSAKGLASIFAAFFLFFISPVTFVLLFFAVVFVAHLGRAKDAAPLSATNLPRYQKRLRVTGLVGVLVSCLLALVAAWVLLYDFESDYALYINVLNLSVIPFVVMLAGWSSILLVRARTIGKMILLSQ